MSVVELMGRLRSSGVEVWADGGTLRYRAAGGPLPEELRSELAQAKPALLEFLGGAALSLPPLRATGAPGPAPLSSGQRRFWFLDQATPADPSHNLPYALRLRGGLDAAVLRQALAAVVARHAVLRTVYRAVDGEPAAFVLDAVDVELLVIPVASHAELRARIHAEFRVGFDLERGPPVRARLLAAGPGDHVLLLTFHHIAFDGWSWGVLLGELAAEYSALLAGATPALAPLALTYADYARWQDEHGALLDPQLDYWREQLAGAPLTFELPADRPRPARQSFAGDVVWLDLPAELTPPLAELARAEGATPFMVLLAAYQAVLSRYTGKTDLLVGTPVAGRRDAALERLVGFFVNMLVLRGDLSGRPTFRELVRRTRDTALAAYAHQDVPFERLVEELQPARDLSRPPVFQTLFALQNAPAGRLRLPGVELEPVQGPTGIAKYDLSLVLEERDGALRGAVEYSTALFERATAERFARHFATLVAAVAAEPDRTIDELSLADATERRQLAAFNATAAPLAPVRFTDLFAAQVAARPEAIAVEDADEALSYAELDRRANQLAHRLRRLGVGPDAAVGLQVDRSAEMIVALLGILKAGGAYVPLDPGYPLDRRAYMLADSGAEVLVTQAGLDDLGGVVVRLDELDGEDAAAPVVRLHDDHLAYVIYTSGSTGRPKGVQVTQRGLTNVLLNARSRPDMTAVDTLLAVVSLSFDASVTEVLRPLTVGARIVVAPGDVARDAVQLVALLEQTRATCMIASAAVGRMLVDGGWAGDGRLKFCAGGEALTAELVAALLERTGELWNDYGPTETTCFSTSDLIRDPHDIAVGRPIDNTHILVLDARGRELPAGAVGEICIGGLGVARGYRSRPDLTAERFVPDPSRGDGARLYRTGDLGRWRPDGRLEFLGRADDQVKVRGFRIEPGEIEAALERHDAVRQAVVVVRPDRAGDPQLVAYVVGDQAGDAELLAHLGQQLPKYMLPAAIVQLPELPATPNGKVDRRALPAPDFGGSHAAHVAPRTATERRVAAVWAEVLALEPSGLGIDDDFFAIGGESMKAVRVVRRLDDGLPVLDLFAHPSVRALAAHLDARADDDGGLLHRLRAPRTEPADVTLVCVPFGGGGAISYRDLAKNVPDGWDVHAVELPGHDYARRDEPLLDLPEAARRCAEEILGRPHSELVLYGHCVGAALTVAIAQELERRGSRLRGVVVGGNFPSARLPGPLARLARLWPGSRMSDRALEDGLRVLGGLSDALGDDERRVLARNVRHDGDQAEEFYTCAFADPGAQRMEAPILCVVGGADRMSDFAAEQVQEWQLFGSRVELEVIERGEHFFNRSHAPELGAMLAGQVARWRAGGAVATPPAPPVRARLSDFLLIALGQLISMIGTGLTTFALGVWAFQETGRVETFATVQIVGLLPAILAAPLAGAIADRFDRRRVMIACDAVGIATAAALMGLVLADALALWHLFALAAVASAAAAFRQPAYVAGATQLVPKRYLGNAAGLLQLGSAGGLVFAQLLGGAVMALAGLGGAAVIDVASYAFALGTLLAVRFPDAAFRRRDEPFTREIVNGWKYLLARRPLVLLTAFFAVANMLGGIAFVLATPLVLSYASTATLGAVLAAQGLGMVAGAVLMTAWGGTRRRVIGMVASVGLFGVSTLALAVRPGPVPAALGMFGIGVCASLITAHWLALVQLKVPTDMQGRVVSTCLMLARLLTPIGFLCAGPLVAAVVRPLVERPGPLHDAATALAPAAAGRPLAVAMLLTGAAALVWTAAGLASRSLRDADALLPDATPPRR